MATAVTEFRYGSVLAKASKLDQVSQIWLVREANGEIEYYHKQNSAWYTIPSEWASKIVWG